MTPGINHYKCVSRIKKNNKRDNRFQKIIKVFEIPKEQINNNTLIQNTLAKEIEEEFEEYRKTFIPNPVIEYRDHLLWR